VAHAASFSARIVSKLEALASIRSVATGTGSISANVRSGPEAEL